MTSDSAFVEGATNRVVAAEQSIERTAFQSMNKAEFSEMAHDIDRERLLDGRHVGTWSGYLTKLGPFVWQSAEQLPGWRPWRQDLNVLDQNGREGIRKVAPWQLRRSLLNSD